MSRRCRPILGVVLLLACGGCSHGGVETVPASPVRLGVGYQPYYAEAWSAVVLRGEGRYQGILPSGTRVKFRVANRGSVLVRELLAGRIQMAYLGDVPAALAAASGKAVVIAAPALSENQCGVLLVAPKAPAPIDDTLRWLNGRRVAVPRNSCSDAFLAHLLQTRHIHPAILYDMAPGTINEAFRSHLIDAAAVWQPAANVITNAGLARVALTGADVHWRDGVFLVARTDLVRGHPDVVLDWLRAERAAEQMLEDPARKATVLEMIGAQAVSDPPAVLRQVYGGLWGAGGLEPQFTLTARARAVLEQARRFLVAQHRLPVGSVLSIDGALARRAAAPAAVKGA